MQGNLLLIAVLCFLCVNEVKAFQLGYAIDDFAKKFYGCSIVQFGIVSQEASELDRQRIVESFNIFLLAQSKTKYFRCSYQTLFASTLKYSKAPQKDDAYNELEIMGELDNFLALIKRQMRTHIHPTTAWHLITFFKKPIISCPAPVAYLLLFEPEVYIKLSGAVISEQQHINVDPSLIDSKFGLSCEITTGDRNDSLDALISREQMKRKNYGRFPCCNLI